MTKARFAEKQQPVTVTQIGEENYFQICLNEAEVKTESGMEMSEDGKADAVTTTEYEYDFNEWHDSITDPEAVKADPEKYLNYSPVDNLAEPVRTRTTEARLSALEQAQEATDQAVQDMIMQQLGG